MDKNQYLKGKKNGLIRQYFYLKKGLDLVNDLKYVGAGIFALYFTLQLSNPLWLIGMFVISIPILIILGWIFIHHMSKVLDWLGIEFATYWSRYSFTLQESILEQLKKLNKNA